MARFSGPFFVPSPAVTLMPDTTPSPARILRKALSLVFVEVLVIGVILFGTAGTLHWPEAWICLAIFTSLTVMAAFGLARADPALLDERTKPMSRDQPLWDKLMVIGLMVLTALWIILPGLDVMRFGWSDMPLWARILGGIGMVGTYLGMYRTMIENSFLVPSVRHQEERAQQVVTTGSYAMVRHPFYAMLIAFFFSTALLLGSWAGIATSLALAFWLALRILGEERLLVRDLAGYRNYQKTTRYRLVPGLW